MDYNYEIIMETDLGERRGSIALREEPEGYRGTLHLLMRDNAIRGTVSEDGRVRLAGKIRTLLQSIPFTASGRLDSQRIDLTLCYGRRSVPVHGVAKGE